MNGKLINARTTDVWLDCVGWLTGLETRNHKHLLLEATSKHDSSSYKSDFFFPLQPSWLLACWPCLVFAYLATHEWSLSECVGGLAPARRGLNRDSKMLMSTIRSWGKAGSPRSLMLLVGKLMIFIVQS